MTNDQVPMTKELKTANAQAAPRHLGAASCASQCQLTVGHWNLVIRCSLVIGHWSFSNSATA
jgi:hypothetical protein